MLKFSITESMTKFWSFYLWKKKENYMAKEELIH